MFRAIHRWLPAYLLRPRARPRPGPGEPLTVFIAVCDHFEPFHGKDKAGALAVMEEWARRWPEMVASHRDSLGRGPRHTFFYPIEQYDRDIIDRLADLCARTGSEVEIHLHHGDDTACSLRLQLEEGMAKLTGHGLLSRDAAGQARYGFIHGNWALDHSHPEGLHCGVPDELAVLKATGCYADFTMPSAPDPAQVPVVNAIYHAREDGRPASHARGTPARAGSTAPLFDDPDHLLLVQGPLGLNWSRRKWGVLPRLENGDITGANPPTLARFGLWTRICPFIQNGPPWIFVKLHTHGGVRRNYDTLLGPPAQAFHNDLARHAAARPGIRYCYVTAREMTNLIHAAERGGRDVRAALEHGCLTPPPGADREA
jgi:hypothetical protein